MQDNLQVEEREVNHHGSLVKVSISFNGDDDVPVV